MIAAKCSYCVGEEGKHGQICAETALLPGPGLPLGLITREGTSLHCAAGKSMLGKGLSGITGQ